MLKLEEQRARNMDGLDSAQIELEINEIVISICDWSLGQKHNGNIRRRGRADKYRN